MQFQSTKHALPLLALTVAAVWPLAAEAQVDELLVTAQKREQSIMDVPVSVTAFSADFLEAIRANQFDDIVRFTPGFTGYNYGVSNPILVIRGLTGNDFGAGADATLGVYVDEVFIGRKTASVSDILDVERIEVVKGPQGTLFGRNSTAGAVSITTKRPGPDFEGQVTIKGGNYDYFQGDAVINVPISDKVFFRAAGRGRERDGYVDNILDDNDFPHDETYAGRAALRLLPNDSLDILLSIDGTWHDGTTPPLKSSYQFLASAFGTTPDVVIALFSPGESLDPFSDIASNLPKKGGFSRHIDEQDTWLASGRIEWDLSEDLTLTSITGWRQYDVDFGDDDDGTPLLLLHTFQIEDGRQFTQELRLNGVWGDLDWFVGASILDDEVNVLGRVEYDESLYLIGPRTLVEERVYATAENFGWAVYADGTLALTDKLNLSAGVRYTDDKRDFTLQIPTEAVNGFNIVLTPTADVPLVQSESWTAWQPRVALDYSWTDNFMTYVSVSRGFRAGGFNTYAAQPEFDPEYVWSYEAGIKAGTADGRLSTQIAGFYYKYKDLQVLLPIGGAFIVQNAAQASGHGVEASVNANPVEGLDLYFNGTWLDAEYDEFFVGLDDRSGNTLTRAPKYTLGVGGQYTQPIFNSLNAFIRADYYYTARQFFNSTNDPFVSQGAYYLINASVGVEGPEGDWRLTAFGENLTDRKYLLTAGGLFGDTRSRAAPLMWGVEASFAF